MPHFSYINVNINRWKKGGKEKEYEGSEERRKDALFLSPSFRTVLFCPKECEEVHVLHFFPFVSVSLESQSIHIVNSFDFFSSFYSLPLFFSLLFSLSFYFHPSNPLILRLRIPSRIEFFHLSTFRSLILPFSILSHFFSYFFSLRLTKKRNKNHDEKTRIRFDDWLGQRSSRFSSGSSSSSFLYLLLSLLLLPFEGVSIWNRNGRCF